MSYIAENLMPNEEIVYQGKVHWFIYMSAIILAAFGVVSLLLASEYPAIALFFFFLSFCSGVRALIYTSTTEFVVTSYRIIVKAGWISRQTMEQQLQRIESVSFTQTVWGRMFGYGTVLLHGTGSGVTPIARIDDPLAFHKHALMAIQNVQDRK